MHILCDLARTWIGPILQLIELAQDLIKVCTKYTSWPKMLSQTNEAQTKITVMTAKYLSITKK